MDFHDDYNDVDPEAAEALAYGLYVADQQARAKVAVDDPADQDFTSGEHPSPEADEVGSRPNKVRFYDAWDTETYAGFDPLEIAEDYERQAKEAERLARTRNAEAWYGSGKSHMRMAEYYREAAQFYRNQVRTIRVERVVVPDEE